MLIYGGEEGEGGLIYRGEGGEGGRLAWRSKGRRVIHGVRGVRLTHEGWSFESRFYDTQL